MPVPRLRDLAAALVLALAAACAPSGPEAPQRDEILWDTWGVPHIYGTSEEAVFRGMGWAQMEAHGDLLLRLYGQARGRAAEYWGEDYLESDRWVRMMGIPRRGQEWLATQPDDFRRDLEAFARGVNDYATAHPERLDDAMEVVLPVTPADVLAHGNRTIHFTFVAGSGVVRQARRVLTSGTTALGPVPVSHEGWDALGELGSNAWAISPGHSADGHAMLLANPHLPWQDLFLFFEAHVVAPGVDVYGTTLVGTPVIAIGFNDHLGWSHTVNTYDGADLYTVEVDGDGYRYGDEVRPFETREETIRVKGGGAGASDGDGSDHTLREETLTVRSTVHGPVVAEGGGRAVALRVAGLDRAGAARQWWDMGKATNLGEFEAALSRLQVPMFNVIYADDQGHILYVFNGDVPRRSGGDVARWRGAVDGDDPATLWTDYLAYGELPRLLDPAVGWVQNANDPPWTSTIPQTLDSSRFPEYLAPHFMHFRAQRSAGMLLADPSISFDELVAYKHSTRMAAADRVLDDLLSAAEDFGDADAREAMVVLDGWDRTADAASRGGYLFQEWLVRWVRNGRAWKTPWDAAAPTTTPSGLADPEGAARILGEVAREVRSRWGALDVPWGSVHHARVGEHEVEVSGAPGDPGGVFRVANFRELDDGHRLVAAGDTYYSAMEFTPDGVNARVLLAYGNATQKHSPHVGDQLELYARKEMRTPWRNRADVEAHVESRLDLSTLEERR